MLRRPEEPLEPDAIVVREGVSWAELEALVRERGERPPRVTYLEGTLELMSPSRSHEEIKRHLVAVIDAYLDHLGITYHGVGAWLLRHAPSAAGLEPDDAYILGEDKPRPDLAIEVVVTRAGLDKLEIYRRLAVPEVWLWDGATHAARVFVLRNGAYAAQVTSAALPGFDFAVAAALVALPALSEVRRAARLRFPPA